MIFISKEFQDLNAYVLYQWKKNELSYYYIDNEILGQIKMYLLHYNMVVVRSGIE